MHDNTVAGYTRRVRTLDCWPLPAASCAMHIHCQRPLECGQVAAAAPDPLSLVTESTVSEREVTLKTVSPV